jgi:hypothetical protein
MPAGATESPVTYDISSIAAKSPQLLRHIDSHKRVAGGEPAAPVYPRDDVGHRPRTGQLGQDPFTGLLLKNTTGS